MRLASRGRPDSTQPRTRRWLTATAALAATVLGAVTFVPSASAGPTDTAIVEDYVADLNITSCRFTKAQLQSTRGYIPNDDPYYSDLLLELDREIARWTSGACNSGNGNGNGNGNGGQTTFAYRASIVSLKVAKNRRSVKVKLRCPSAAPSACKVKLSGKLKGKKAATSKTSTVARGSSKTVKVKLTASTASKLKSKGGKLKISAKTTGSSLGSASRSVQVPASA